MWNNILSRCPREPIICNDVKKCGPPDGRSRSTSSPLHTQLTNAAVIDAAIYQMAHGGDDTAESFGTLSAGCDVRGGRLGKMDGRQVKDGGAQTKGYLNGGLFVMCIYILGLEWVLMCLERDK